MRFGVAQIKHRNRGTPREQQTLYDFSFSGIKTAVLRYVDLENMRGAIAARQQALDAMVKPTAADLLPLCDSKTLDLIASFQSAVVDDLVSKTLTAAREREVRALLVTGGVAANSELRETFSTEAAKEGLTVLFPSRSLSTDNAAMIAAAAWPRFQAGEFAVAEFSAEALLSLR